ncbi:ribosomal RNA small subunit methyltransferase A [Candidatus Peregrinibacteria bacterium]|jgi:16S rRNA (adenine1518-N6/adenine1519-N6)-dimethyltransferase|nr:ribosomal RNA small subunit methyltransferase A [Candidatus Peregrinibacteria bacterium]MBT4055875.1 ribosomal RNA small subunit methyltransferase A [Candidatus Peregrinibacteria bacterium]
MPQIRAKKSLGQNFLNSPTIIKKIVTTSGITAQDKVLEIGPGLGALTTKLIETAKEVLALELDQTLIPILEEKFPKPQTSNLTILHQDALKFDPSTHPITKDAYHIVANIPYYITSPLITHFVTSKNPPKSLTLLVQKEVAEKVCAQTPSRPKLKHSILSIQTQLYAKPRLAFKIAAKHFSPKPKVDSMVIHLETHPKPLYKNPEKILTLAKQAFSGKRKKLSNTLKNPPNFPDFTLPEKFKDLRPEHLSLKDWETLAS